jgi:hypothetical protein
VRTYHESQRKPIYAIRTTTDDRVKRARRAARRSAAGGSAK